MKIKVVIADDQSLVREGIKIMLKDIQEIELVGFAKNGKQTLEQVAEKMPDILILDIEMPDINGLTLTQKINREFKHTKIIILSSFETSDYVTRAIDAGAKAYLSKSALIRDLSWTIQLVYRGYSTFKTDLLSKVFLKKEKSLYQCQQQINSQEKKLRQTQSKPAKTRFFQANGNLQSRRYNDKITNKYQKSIKKKINRLLSCFVEKILKWLDRFWSR